MIILLARVLSQVLEELFISIAVHLKLVLLTKLINAGSLVAKEHLMLQVVSALYLINMIILLLILSSLSVIINMVVRSISTILLILLLLIQLHQDNIL